MPKKVISKKSKRRLMIFGTISIFLIGYFFVTLIGYLYNYTSLKNEEAALKAELIALQDEKVNLKIEIQKLNDPSYVARYAKEKFLYSSDGEYVIKIDANNTRDVIVESKNSNIYIIVTFIVLGLILLIVKKKASSKN